MVALATSRAFLIAFASKVRPSSMTWIGFFETSASERTSTFMSASKWRSSSSLPRLFVATTSECFTWPSPCPIRFVPIR